MMSVFTEQVAADMAVFLNADEFGESHVIDGQTVICVLDSSVGEQFAGAEGEGLWASAVALFARTADLEALDQGLPKAGRALDVDGRDYTVISVGEEMGITRVGMELVRS